MNLKKLVLILCVLSMILSCRETDIINESGKMQLTDIQVPKLPDGYFYNGWLLVDGSFVSVGKITNDSITNNLARFDKIDAMDLKNAQSFALTVETSTGVPSDFVLLIGNFNGNTAQLHTNTQAVNGVQTLGQRISAGFTVQNASVPPEQSNDYGTNGVWFFKGIGNEKEPTLHLDYKGLIYQAWLSKTLNSENWLLNMGQIQSDTLADNWQNFIPAPFAANIPDFPGEDFLQQPSSGTAYPEGFFPTDVKEAKVILTPIFSNYNNNEIPFPVYLFEANIPSDAVKDSYQVFDMQLNTTYTMKVEKL